MGKLYLHAANIHQGGGRSLLTTLLNNLPETMSIVLLHDARMSLPGNLPSNVQKKCVIPSIAQRFFAEIWLSREVEPEDIVLCLGNLPPLFKVRGHTVVFMQNRYLIDDVKLHGFAFKVRLRLLMERFWLVQKMAGVDEFVVQSPAMKRTLDALSIGAPVHILPFIENPVGYERGMPQLGVQKESTFDFLYVASGEPHKNHSCLIDAWRLLAEEGLFPSLCLTLDETVFPSLCRSIEAMCKQHQMKIVNLGALSHEDVLALYKKSGALIYPSNFESFGLPLIEARQAGLPVLASELDYVRDVLDPEQTFSPQSPTSIARAVRRFMGQEEEKLPLMGANDFIEHIIASSGRRS